MQAAVIFMWLYTFIGGILTFYEYKNQKLGPASLNTGPLSHCTSRSLKFHFPILSQLYVN